MRYINPRLLTYLKDAAGTVGLRSSDQLMDHAAAMLPPPRRGHRSQLATRACCHPMNDQPSGRDCRQWPSGICL